MAHLVAGGCEIACCSFFRQVPLSTSPDTKPRLRKNEPRLRWRVSPGGASVPLEGSSSPEAFGVRSACRERRLPAHLPLRFVSVQQDSGPLAFGSFEQSQRDWINQPM